MHSSFVMCPFCEVVHDMAARTYSDYFRGYTVHGLVGLYCPVQNDFWMTPSMARDNQEHLLWVAL